MTTKLWNLSVTAIKSLGNAPGWLREQSRLSFEEVTQLPPLDIAVDGQNALPSIEEKILKPDYLDFLREQIKLEPRGPEWNRILKERLAALEPSVNKAVVTAMFFRKPDTFTLRINPETKSAIQAEG